MKNRIFSLGVIALSFAACSVNEMDIATPADKEAEEFFATIEDASTKVFVDDELMVLWHADDRVSIFNKYTYNQQYRFTGNTGANSGSFTKVPNDDFITGNALNYVYAIYPYKESTEISNQGVLTIDLPAIQSYAENSFGIGANTMISCSEGNELLFKNLCGYIMLKLYGDDVSVTSISIKGNNNEPLAGKATVNASIDNAPTMTFDASATNEITLSFDTPVTLGTTAESATTFWLVVPPTTFSKGITLTVKDDKNGEFKKSTTASLQISRNTLKRMSALEAKPEPSNDAIVFADEKLKDRLVTKFDTNGDGELSYKEAAAVTSFEGAITIATISSFNEFQFFTGLTSIPKECFKNWAKLESIILPNTITSIGDSAFYGCSALHGITIPNSVKSIGNNVFNGCSSIISIELPNSITRIEQRTFYNCISLKAISIPKSLNYIGKEAFAKCYEMTKIYVESLTSWLNIQCTEYGSHPLFNDEVEGELYIAGNELTDVTIPKEITTIRTNAFKNCTHISKVTIHNNVSSIGESAFYRTNTSNIVIPESVRTIGSHAFAICTKLTSISLPESVTELGDDAFFKCESLVSIIIPESITKINDGVFFHCTGLTSVILPNSITSIGDMSFSGCTALTSIELPESLVELVRMSFYECTGLASITIPKNVTKISDSFSNCTGLNSIIMYPVTPPTGRAGMLYLTNDCPIYVPAESVDAYKTADYWSNYADRIQAIPDFFFNGKPLAKEDENVYSGIVSLQKNEVIKLDGDIQLSSFWLDPDFVVNGYFNAVNGLYKVTLNKGDFTITFRRVNADGSAPNLSEGGLYLQGWGVAEKKMSEFIGWPGTGGYQLAQVSDGVYQFTGKAVNENATEIGGRFRRDYVKFGYFFQDGWGNEASAGVTISGNAASLFEQESDNKFHNLVEQNASLDLGATYRLIIDFTNTTISGNAITSGIETVRIDKL